MSIYKLLLVIILSLAALAILVYIREIPSRIANGEQGRVAIYTLDEVRRPFLAIQAAEVMFLKNGYDEETRAGLERGMENGNRLIARYRDVAAYDAELLRRVELLASAYKEWLRAVLSILAIVERAKFSIVEQPDTRNIDVLHTANIESASGFSRVMRLLGDTEYPVHKSIEQGSRAATELMILGGAMLAGILLFIFFLMNSRNRLLGDMLAQQKKARKELQFSEERLANAQRIARLGNWQTDLRNDTLWWSDETYRIFGLNPGGHNASRELLWDSIHPEDRDMVARAHDMALGKNKQYNIDHRIVLADGSVKYVHDQAEVTCDDDGEPVSMSGTIQDITERKEAEEEQRQSEERFRTLADGFSQGILVHRDFRPLYANTTLAEMFGFVSVDDILAIEKIDVFFALEDKTRIKKYRDFRLRGEDAPADYTFSALRKDGSRMWLNNRSFVIDWGGEPAICSTLFDVTENKRAHESVLKLSQAVEQSPASIVITDTDGNIEYVNSSFEKATGYAFDEVFNRNPRLWSSGERPQEEYKDLWDTIKSGRTWSGVFHNRRKDETLFWEQAIISPIRNADGKVTNFLAIKEDITEQKQNEDALRTSEARLANAQRIARLGNWRTDLRNNTLWWSDEIYGIFGLNPREHSASRELFRDSIHPEDRDMVARAYDMALANKSDYDIDHRIVLADGSVKYVHDQAEVTCDDDGDPISMSGTIQDITERKEAEKELEKSRDELELRVVERTNSLTEEIQERRTIEQELLDKTELQQLLYAVTVIANEADDTDAAMAACLKEICDYTTWPVGHIYVASSSDPDKLIPTEIWHMEDPEWFSFFHDITMKTVFEKGTGLPGRVLVSGKPEWIEDVTKDENFPRAKQKRKINIKAGFCFPIKVRNEVVAVMEFFSPFDQKENQSLMHSIELIGTQLGRLHERAEAERTLLEAKKNADAANMAKSTFLSSMSHELRTPMNAILGFAQMLEFNPKEPLSEVQKGSVGHIMEGGQHLLELINDVLDLAKVEAGKVDLSIEDVCARTVLDECLLLIHTMADERGIEIVVGKGFNTTAVIRADHTRFRQSLLNMMSNAVKYNRENGKITLDCHEAPGGMLHISVTDTGEGIPGDMLGKLFEPFSRLGAENTEIEGTGIGLTITKQLVERMDGHIGVDTEVGKGTTFWIELPLAEGKLIDETVADQETADDGAKRLPDIAGTVLYIEDNPGNLRLMEVIIECIEGLSMISAHNAELGIELAKNKKPDLIILDINLPGMNGFEALKRLQRLKKTKGIPIIALSANAMPRDIEKGIKAGFKQYLTKPMKVEEAVNTIKDVLES